MAELDDLYQELILDHYKRPRNRRSLDHPDRMACGDNPLCGDRVKISLKLDGDVVRDVAFEGSGCAISTASASLMTEAIKGKTVAEAQRLFQRFRSMVTGHSAGDGPDAPRLGKLEVFSGIRQFPVRVKCAVLAWHTLDAALQNRGETISTEVEDSPAAAEPHPQPPHDGVTL